MNAFKIVLKVLLFAVGLFLTGWFFMPWKQVGEAVLLRVSRLAVAPVSFVYASVKNAPGGFTVDGLEVRRLKGIVDVSFNTLTITPDLTASLLNMAPTCRIVFNCEILSPKVTLGNGRFTLSVNRQGIFLDGLRSDGELAMNGSLLINPSAMTIIWADVAMEVKSDIFEESLPSLQMLLNLPLQQESSGRWFLRRSLGS